MESEHIAGDMNNMLTGFSKESGVYQIKNMRPRMKNIKISKVISDHPILIYQMNIFIPLHEGYEEINIFIKIY